MQTPVTSSADDGRIPIPVALEELPELDGREVARCNADLAQFGRRVFSVAGAPVLFHRASENEVSRSELDTELARPGSAWLWLEWSGVPLLAVVSPALAEAVAQMVADTGVDQLGPSGMELFGQLMLAPRLPEGLMLRQIGLSRMALGEMPSTPELLGTWWGRHRGTGEPSGHRITVFAAADFPLVALLTVVAGMASAILPSPLAGLPIPMPLVAARWSVDALQLIDLAVGDVLILN